MHDDTYQYLITRGVRKRLNRLAANAGHSDDEIRDLHRLAHEGAMVTGLSHVGYFKILLQVVAPKAPDTFIPIAKGPSMLSNWLFRFQQLISRWQSRGYRKKRRFERMTGQDD